MVSYKALNTNNKRITNYCNYATRNCDAGERFATAKSTVSNRRDTIWDFYVGERVATDKSLLSNRCDTIWDIYACERFAITKSKVTNRCNSITNYPPKKKNFQKICTSAASKIFL